jgi:hypothetical protein
MEKIGVKEVVTTTLLSVTRFEQMEEDPVEIQVG